MAGDFFPEVAKPDSWQRKRFAVILGLVSASVAVEQNLHGCVDYYATWEKAGTFLPPTKTHDGKNFSFPGKSQVEAKKGIAMLGRLLAKAQAEMPDMKEGELWDHLITELSEGADVPLGSQPHGKQKDTSFGIGGFTAAGLMEKYDESRTGVSKLMRTPGMLLFGPKRGAFILNILGNHSAFTADQWASRTIGRHTGLAFKPANLSTVLSHLDEISHDLSLIDPEAVGEAALSGDWSAEQLATYGTKIFDPTDLQNDYGIGYGKWTHIDGWSEAVFDYIIEDTKLL